MPPRLEPITQTLNYGDLPETWRVPEVERFSREKTLYDYQEDALRCAARALYLYYGKTENDYQPGESRDATVGRKRSFANRYRDSISGLSIKKYETNADRQNRRQNPVFRILSEFITPRGEEIPYEHLANRMCFWMATGSGKTLVMVKLIEHLHFLKKYGEIPPHNILILAPSDHLLGQIRRTVEEFNQSGLYIDLVPLREIHRSHQGRLGDVVTVYYHRSDNISDVQKEALTDYRTYENGGKWYVLLDEAHKGGKEDSKRQAYYAIMAREGFLFNFSATFTDQEDIVTTVKKYNLEEFIENGHGKSIYLNEKEYDAFKNKGEEISHEERRKIVLKSLLTLAYVSMRVGELREKTSLEQLYHLPLMLTLVNSVNTDVEKERNDLWAFFQTLREIATGEIDGSLFEDSKQELVDDWRNARLLFGGDGGGIIGIDETLTKKMTIAALRQAVFFSRRKGSLQFIRSGDHKELAFQMKNADSPFALIRIGDTSRWRNELLAGYEATTTLQEKSFFDGLEQSRITILMGSRSFFESWDSNRPNVINFINVGGKDAKKFVVQSVGRGVRIETLPNQRRRFAHLPDSKEKQTIQHYHDWVQPPETLFLFATNRNAVQSVLEGLETEKGSVLKRLEGFERAQRPKINGAEMPLLVPEYKDAQNDTVLAAFAMSDEARKRFKIWLKRTSGPVFAVRDGLTTRQISDLRDTMEKPGKIKTDQGKNYASLPFLQSRVVSHLSCVSKASDGVRELDENVDIVHFREIRASSEYIADLQGKIERVVSGEVSDKEVGILSGQLARGELMREEFNLLVAGTSQASFKQLTIKRLAQHYYLPVILGQETADYIQHVIKVESEVNFLNALEEWVRSNTVSWDAWMFSKIDESLDNVRIPYYDNSVNEYRRFLPDFVFWMCRENEYRIVFVDPKGTEYASAYRKIEGYRKLFMPNGEAHRFKYRSDWQVSVNFFLYNPEGQPLQAYKQHWISDPGYIFMQNVPQRSDA